MCLTTLVALARPLATSLREATFGRGTLAAARRIPAQSPFGQLAFLKSAVFNSATFLLLPLASEKGLWYSTRRGE